jgi:crotonobetainyl-CoA:carnitine CoA-transferase CaiB-like acyl-CoA transferase
LGERELLSNIFILDLADKGGEFCSKVLADLGASVSKIKIPDGDPAKSAFHDFESLLFSYHNANKCEIVLDPRTPRGNQDFRELLKRADILVENLSAGRLKSLDWIPEFPDIFNPRLIRIILPEQTSYPESLYAAITAVLSLKKREFTAKGCCIDLSSRESRNATADLRTGDPRDRQFQILPCKDGFIQLTILRNLETLVELMDAEQIAVDREGIRECPIEQIESIVAEWTRRHTKGELFALGQAMRFPWAPVETPEEVLESPQLRSRQFFVHSAPLGKGPAIPFPGAPYKFSTSVPPPQASSTSEREIGGNRHIKTQDILGGLRIIDLTRMISGPYATRILADFGAEVIKIQSRTTARGAEQNDTAHFATWNRNKRSLCLDLGYPEARELFIQLTAISDVVVENFSPRVMPNWELDYSRLRQVKPDLVMASISAMGQAGPWKDFVGFAATFHALSGLLSIVSPLNGPENIQTPYGDIITGLYSALAILAAVRNRDRTGEGRHIDVSAYEAVCTMIAPALISRAAGVEANEYTQDFGWNSLLYWERTGDSKAAPALGQDNHSIIVDLLGHSEEEYESLIAKGML